ncbi:MAG: AzlD domain-containing protein [Clostridia bacterium]|jgi:branched-subunit amino acid transport protein
MEKEILLVIVGMSLVTYLPRVLPIAILSKVNLPDWFLSWLKYIPVAVLAALLAPTLFMQDGHVALSFSNKALWASIPCFFVAARTRNLFLTVSVGIVAMFLLNLI